MHDNTCVVVFVLSLFYIATSQEGVFQGFTLPCNDTSPQCIKDCLHSVLPEFGLGIPSLGIDALDPLNLEKVDLKMSGGLHIQFRQGRSKGFRNCVVDSADAVGYRFNAKLRCNITIEGKYKSFGRMLIFPIDGEGDAKIICKNISLMGFAVLGTAEVNGEEYWEIKNYHVKHAYDGQVIYKISNLFKDNPQISDMVLEFMNQNWRAVSDEFGDPIVNYGIKAVLSSVQKLFKTVPKKQLIRSV